jgi:hypothetical protein
MTLFQRVTNFFWTQPTGSNWNQKPTLKTGRVALVTLLAGAPALYYYRASLKSRIFPLSIAPTPSSPLPQPTPAPLPPLLADIAAVMSPSLKEHFPEIESLLEKIHKQMHSSSTQIRHYVLHQKSGPSINLEVAVAVYPRKSPSMVNAALYDPLPQYQQLCQAIKKMAPPQGVAVQMTFPPPANTLQVANASVTFPADLVQGVTPHPEALLAAIEQQSCRSGPNQHYHLLRDQDPVYKCLEIGITPPTIAKMRALLERKIFSIFNESPFSLISKQCEGFPHDRLSVTISKELQADPLFPLLIDALKIILYKREGKLPAFILHY